MLSCGDIDERLQKIAQTMDKLENRISSNRGDNQALGYFSAVLFPPLLLATEENASEKASLDDNQSKRDRLIGLRTAKKCPGTSDPRTGRILSK